MRAGRPEKTTHREIELVAFELFASRGFEATTVDDIAAEIGVSRRTVFRYFPSKNDIVWGDFDWVIGRLRDALHSSPRDEPLIDSVARAVVVSNSYSDDELERLRARISLIVSVPTLQAHSVIRYRAWRHVVAAFAGDRLGLNPAELAPQVIAHAALGTSVAAFTRWATIGGGTPVDDLERAFRILVAGLD